ncbi:hypothetical protein [Mycolicibacterium aubagnense]|uniref:hypothetical protein n=1 Tax=Mycolicibacterium aubagnense TaxID=319707 RepID=UPI0010FE55E4|nr:hypothetical protein [Mycolicibacterium aubagnense]TLH48549.1 hypothetical protein C1S80_29965 [Mycolicibacterium aubagnense]
MQIPDSIIDPATAKEGVHYVIAFIDDDWDRWTGPEQAAKYRGWRRNGRWWFSDLLSDRQSNWDYADDEVIILSTFQAA